MTESPSSKRIEKGKPYDIIELVLLTELPEDVYAVNTKFYKPATVIEVFYHGI